MGVVGAAALVLGRFAAISALPCRMRARAVAPPYLVNQSHERVNCGKAERSVALKQEGKQLRCVPSIIYFVTY